MRGFGGQGSLRAWERFDAVLALAALALVGYGLVLIYSGSLGSYDGPAASLENPVARQGLFAFLAIGAMAVISRMDYHVLLHYAWWFYGASILLLILLIPIGQTDFGSTRWFAVGPIQFQPSEFAKIATVLLLARFLGEQGGTRAMCGCWGVRWRSQRRCCCLSSSSPISAPASSSRRSGWGWWW